MDHVSRHRFLTVFPSSDASVSPGGGVDELSEDDVLWTHDFTEPPAVKSSEKTPDRRNSGILAALPESNSRSVLSRKSSIPSSKAIPLLPRTPQPNPEREYASQSLPSRKMNQSAPMNVPVLSIAMAKRLSSRFEGVDDDVDDGDEEKLPPHEIVARGSRNSPRTTFSVLEGVGRTLKGRDLRQVRNAVWRQTGFLD